METRKGSVSKILDGNVYIDFVDTYGDDRPEVRSIDEFRTEDQTNIRVRSTVLCTTQIQSTPVGPVRWSRLSIDKDTTHPKPTVLEIQYTNWRGETRGRRLIPQNIWFGCTSWHPSPQWLITAIDVDDGTTKDFAMAGFGTWARKEEK